MNISTCAFLITLIFLTLSCKKEETVKNNIQPTSIKKASREKLIGEWKSYSILLAGQDHVKDLTESGHHFQFDSTGTFHKTYVHGNWSINQDTVIMVPDKNYHLHGITWKYKIASQSADTLVFETEQTEGDYGGDFEEFSTDELLTIVEKYVRER